MTIDLPLWPPSNNVYYRNVHGRMVMSKPGRLFIEDGCRHIKPIMNREIPFKGRLGVNIRLYPPTNAKRDVDNFLKAVLDLMTKAGVWEDDSQVDQLTVSRETKVKGGKVIIEIWQRPGVDTHVNLLQTNLSKTQ